MKSRLNDIGLRAIGIPLLAGIAYLISNYQKFSNYQKPSTSAFTNDPYYFLLLLIFVSLIWHLNRFIHVKARKYYEQFNTKKAFIKGWFTRLALYGLITTAIVF